MQKITPHLWFDKQAKEAAELYTSLIPDSSITHISTIHDTPSGDCDIVSFSLAGQPFMAISAGPMFSFNPSISFHIRCHMKEEVKKIWQILSEGGKVLMELGEYPFSQLYGWIQDKFGLSWQVIFVGDEKFQQKIVPVLTYTGKVSGKTEEAVNFYTSLFKSAPDTKDSKIVMQQKYGTDEQPNVEGIVKYTHFILNGTEFGAMDGGTMHDFIFNEAISLIIPCDNQEKIDYFWNKLSAVPEAEQCGWCKDKYGVSWQVWPTAIGEMMEKGKPDQIDRVTKAFLQMKKYDIAALNKAFSGGK